MGAGRVYWDRGMVLGGYTGWVIQGSEHGKPTFAKGDLQTAERAPEAPQGLEWVVCRSEYPVGAAPWYHPSGPVGHPWCPPCTRPPLAARLLANKGEI